MVCYLVTLKISCPYSGSVCTAIGRWKFGQFCWCEEHSCWNGHIFPSTGKSGICEIGPDQFALAC